MAFFSTHVIMNVYGNARMHEVYLDALEKKKKLEAYFVSSRTNNLEATWRL
jgi:hypothetical protein